MNFDEAIKEMEGVVINLNELPFTAFEVWFEDQDFYTNMRFIHGDKLFDKDGGAYRVLPVQMTYLAWLVGRAGIKEMDEVIKLQDADLRKYEKQIEGLKEQLNNMEACYIEKKKEVEELQKTNISLEAGLRKNSKNKQKLLGKNIELQKRIDEYKKLTTSIRNEFDLWSDDSEFADVIEDQIENLEALRGGS
nr:MULTISPECIES: hypothetical protein [unclassified Acinetobacter]